MQPTWWAGLYPILFITLIIPICTQIHPGKVSYDRSQLPCQGHWNININPCRSHEQNCYAPHSKSVISSNSIYYPNGTHLYTNTCQVRSVMTGIVNQDKDVTAPPTPPCQGHWNTKLRISSHSLRIESGRHTFPKTAIEDRICNHCDLNKVEDEYHFVMECALYNTQRLKFLSNIGNMLNCIDGMSMYDNYFLVGYECFRFWYS